ncbi:MAG: peptidoglycan D,D-transpeptidase FtsI family protein [Phycisphaerales bacterium]
MSGLRTSWVALLTAGGCFAVFAAVLTRVGYLQTQEHERLAVAAGSRHGVVETAPVRGTLHDRRGRVIAVTRFGQRVFVDPVRFPDPPGDAIVELASALDAEPWEIGERIARAMSANAEAVAGDGARLRRYVRISDALPSERAERVLALGIPGVHVEDAPVREYPALDDVASLVGKVGASDSGLMGVEYAFESRLSGSTGSARYVRDASRRALWIEPGTWRAPENGTPIRVSIDLAIQRIALEELQRGVLESDAAGGRVVVADPQTGEILAMADLVREVPDAVPYPWWPVDRPVTGPVEVPTRRYAALLGDDRRMIHPALGRNRCVEDVYEPGSSFKPFVWALVTDAGLATLGEVFDTHGGYWRTPYGRPIEDVTRRSEMTWHEVLVNSSNIGIIKAASRLSYAALRDGVVRLGFGRRTRIGLPGEAEGIVTAARDWKDYTQTSVAFGHEIAVTPMQMVRAFSALCRTGELSGTIPDLTLMGADGAGPGVSRRVFRPETVVKVRAALREVAEKVERTMDADGEVGWRYTMFGKSGTADLPVGPAPEGYRRPPGASGYLEEQYVSSFIAGAPVDAPRIVLVVVIDDPGPERIKAKKHYGSQSAGPVARRIVERTLAYLRVTPDITPTYDANTTERVAASR